MVVIDVDMMSGLTEGVEPFVPYLAIIADLGRDVISAPYIIHCRVSSHTTAVNQANLVGIFNM